MALEDYGYNYESDCKMNEQLYDYKRNLKNLSAEELDAAEELGGEYWACQMAWYGYDDPGWIEIFAEERKRRKSQAQ